MHTPDALLSRPSPPRRSTSPRVAVVSTPADEAAYVGLLARQRRWLEAELGAAVDELQPSLVREYDDTFGHYRHTGTVPLLARLGGRPVGIAALRPFDALADTSSSVELKRVFVADEARGSGAGRALVETAVQVASLLGCRRVVLESHAGIMATAVALYRSVGFVEAPPLGLTRYPGVLTLALDLETTDRDNAA